MARPLRLEFRDAVYHVSASSNERKEIFRDDCYRGQSRNELGASVYNL